MNYIQRQTPLLIACSSTIKTPELEEELNDIGFDYFIEQPLKYENVCEII